MKRILITGGTVFVSKFIATYYVKKGYEVYVLNRDTKTQVEGVKLIACDRYSIGNRLKGKKFDAILDVALYTKSDVKCIVEALDEIHDYIFISSSAIYPENTKQPFSEEEQGGYNSIWKDYGVNKYEAEQYLKENVPQAYILRPPYLYGPMENLYRASFVFDCALKERKFYLPKDGQMKLQFFHVEDLCKFIDVLLEQHPDKHIYNVGNRETVTVKEWVELCYQAVGKKAEFVNVYNDYEQREYFCFYDYEYILDVSSQNELLKNTKDLLEGLKESYSWYIKNEDQVAKKDYLQFIDNNLTKE